MSNKIQIAIACGVNSEKYAEFLIKTIEQTMSGSNEIEYIMGISHVKVNKKYISDIPAKNPMRIIDIFNSNERNNSGHGLALDALLKNLDKEYGMFIDSDVAMLCKDWDTKMMSSMNNKTIITGAGYPIRKNKYRDFPTATFCLFKTDILKQLNISFMPLSLHHKHKIRIDEEKANAFGLPKNASILIDTGWELPVKIKKAGYNGCCLPAWSNRNCQSLFSRKFGGYEYHMENDVIATHLGHSSNIGFDDPIAFNWAMGAQEWINNNKK